MKKPKRNQSSQIIPDRAERAAIVSRHVQLPVTRLEDAAAFATTWGPMDLATAPTNTPARVTRPSAAPEPDKGSVAEPVN